MDLTKNLMAIERSEKRIMEYQHKLKYWDPKKEWPLGKHFYEGAIKTSKKFIKEKKTHNTELKKLL
jgi:hypothetical protein